MLFGSFNDKRQYGQKHRIQRKNQPGQAWTGKKNHPGAAKRTEKPYCRRSRSVFGRRLWRRGKTDCQNGKQRCYRRLQQQPCGNERHQGRRKSPEHFWPFFCQSEFICYRRTLHDVLGRYHVVRHKSRLFWGAVPKGWRNYRIWRRI